jgi:hypothetical protein
VWFEITFRVEFGKLCEVVYDIFAVDFGDRGWLTASTLTFNDMLGNVNLRRLLSIHGRRNEPIWTCKGEGSRNSSAQLNMSIVDLIHEELKLYLESVLILVVASGDITLNLFENLNHVDWKLLVTFRGIL